MGKGEGGKRFSRRIAYLHPHPANEPPAKPPKPNLNPTSVEELLELAFPPHGQGAVLVDARFQDAGGGVVGLVVVGGRIGGGRRTTGAPQLHPYPQVALVAVDVEVEAGGEGEVVEVGGG